MMHAQQSRKGYSVDDVLGQFLTPFRMKVLNKAMQGEKEKFGDFVVFAKELEAALIASPDIDESAFLAEHKKVQEVLERGVSKEAADISRPESQLLWGAALLYIHSNFLNFERRWSHYFKDISETPIWKQVAESETALQMLRRHAQFVSEGLRREGTRFNWGLPGTMFYFSPDQNFVNMDLPMSMMLGIEHCQAALFHEIGHSQLTVGYSKKMQKIRDDMEKLQEKKKNDGKLSVEDYKKLRLLAAEWSFRFRLFDAAENNCVNRFTANLGKNIGHQGAQIGQEFDYSLNNIITTLRYGMVAQNYDAEKKSLKAMFNAAADPDGVEKMLSRYHMPVTPETRKQLKSYVDQQKKALEAVEKNLYPDDGMIPEAQQVFSNLITAAGLFFYQHNGLFPNTVEGWRRAGIKVEWIKRASGKDGKGKKGPKASKGKIANDNKGGDKDASFPSADFQHLWELCSGKEGLENLQPRLQDRWYGIDYYRNLVDKYCDKRTAIMDQIWDEYLAPHAEELFNKIEQQIDEQLKQDQNGQDGQDGQEGQEGQDGQGQDGQGQPGQGQPGQGQPGQGQPGQGQPGQPQEGDFDPTQEGVNKDGDEVDVDTGNGTESMPDVDTPPETPQGQDGQGQGQDGEGQDGQDANGDGQAGKTLEELEEALKKLQDEALNDQNQDGQDGQDADGQGQQEGQKGQPGDGQSQGKSQDGPGGDGGQGPDFMELARNISKLSYPELVARLMGPILQVERAMRKIQEKQIETVLKKSRELERLPQDKDLSRLNKAAHRAFAIKRATGQPLDERDLDRFHKDKRFTKPTEIDFVFLIDGSASMNNRRGGAASALEAALLSTIILKEAAERIGANVYIMMWGSDNPVLLGSPDDDKRDVGVRLGKVTQGLHSGTSMAPAIQKITEELAKKRKKSANYAGMTHMMVFSDGDIFDDDKTTRKVNALFKMSPHTTLDFAVLKTTPRVRASAMENLATRIRSENPLKKIGVFAHHDPEQIPVGAIGLILDKLKVSKSFSAILRKNKIDEYKRALRRMDRS